MASQMHDLPSRTSAKATNSGGRPRKYATPAEARAHETEKQRLQRHQRRQSRNSKPSPQTLGGFHFIPYQPQGTKPRFDLPTQAVQQDEELGLDIPASKATLEERLNRMESMLRSLTRKVDAPQPNQKFSEDSQESEDEALISSDTNENAPVLRLFDYVVAGGHRDLSNRSNDSKSFPGTISTLPPKLSPKLEKLRNTLAALLPPQRDLDLIVLETDAWVLLKPICILLGDLYGNYDPRSFFNLSQTSMSHPTIIARSLIYISLSIQQLPPDFEISRLSIGHNIDTVVNKYASTVSELVTSNDELAGSIEGLECGILLTFFHINAGNLRRAWLPCRKALNIAQMKGFHRDMKKLSESLGPARAAVSKNIWYKIVGLDRFLAIILGLPVGSKCDKFGPDEKANNPRMNPDMIFLRRLSNITNEIIERNEDDSGSTFTLTQEIDEKMDILRKEMPQGYWTIPPVPVGKRFEADDLEYLRLTYQTWFFHLEGFLHLPYMLRATTEPRYDYNKTRCLASSRELIVRYLALKHSGPKICCKIVDFAGFTAGIILVLNLVSSPHQSGSMEMKSCKDEDRSLLQSLITYFDTLASDPREVIAAQSVVVIRKVLAASRSTSRETKLAIPYLGTVTIIHQTVGGSQSQRQPVQTNPYSYSSRSGYTDFLYNGEHQQYITPDQTVDSGYIPQYFSVDHNMTAPTVSLISSQFGSMNPELAIPDVEWTEGYSVYFDTFSASDTTGFDSLEFP